MKKYKQLKDLPMKKAGAIWEIDGTKIKIDGQDYTYCSPDLYKNLVLYYSDDDGNLNMEGEWFEIAGAEDEKKLELKKEREKLINESDYYEAELERITQRLNEIDNL